MTDIDLRELRCFVAVADHLNFSAAARQLNLSQPPLTRHIQALEDKLGARVFNRNTHSVALTEAGALFLEDARAILGHVDRAVHAVHRAHRGESTRLRLAFIGAFLDEKLVGLIQRFRKSHPACQIQITDLAPSAQLAAIKAGELDGGFIGVEPLRTLKDLSYLVWQVEPFVLAVPESDPLAQVRVLRWIHLRNLNWVLVSRQAANAFRQQFAELEKTHALSARIVQESDRIAAILTMVAAGNGTTLVPQSLTRLISKGVTFRKLPSPEPRIHHAFAYRSQKISPALSDFIKLLREK